MSTASPPDRPSAPADRLDADQTFVLRPALPVRGSAIGAVAVLVGAVLLVSATEFAWPAAWSWLGLVLMLAGIAVAVAAWISVRRLRSEVIVRPAGITVAGVRGRTTLPWSEVDRVTSVNEQLVLVPATDRPEVIIVNPRGRQEPALLPLVAAIKLRLDASRGYRNLS